MNTAAEIIKELEAMGSDSTKKTLLKHGAREPFFGTKIEDMKKIVKRIKKDYALSKELYNTGISDAMYLAGLISDPQQMTKADLQGWVEKAYWSMLNEYAVPWTAAESPHAMELSLEWIESKDEMIATAGWATLSSYVFLKPDEQLDLQLLSDLIERVKMTIHQQPDRVRYAMNGFLIAVGGAVAVLTEAAAEAGKAIGKVKVDMNGTACKVPDVADYIRKMEARGVIGRKKKTAKC